MGSKYRLTSSAFERRDKSGSEKPLKVYFLSVEGNDTEVRYFEGIRVFKNEIGINALVDIEVLKRSKRDTSSAPEHVIELLEEFIAIRGSDDQEIVDQLTPEFVGKYSKDFIEHFIQDPSSIAKRQRNAFLEDMFKIGYDLQYRKYLSTYNNEIDEFCVIVDKDQHTNISRCLADCQRKGYKIHISNPCFEFWLLLHLTNVYENYKHEDLLKNEKKSNAHTFVSYEVSRITGHGKTSLDFEHDYLPNIDKAIELANKYEIDPINLLHNVGTNIGELINSMRNSI